MAGQGFDMMELFPAGKPLIGVVHLLPLPGSPRYAGSMEEIVDRACRDARAYTQGGLDGLILENYGDLPFFPGTVPAEVVAAMTLVGAEMRRVTSLPTGINVLRNDSMAAMSLASALNSPFIRVNVLMGAMVTDQGIVQGQAHRLLRQRMVLGSPAKIFADVMVKHAHALVQEDLDVSARELVGRGLADALIVTGRATGEEPVVGELKSVKQAVGDVPVLVGSGVTPENASGFLELADGAIVGTSLKKDGQTENEVDVSRVRDLLKHLGR